MCRVFITGIIGEFSVVSYGMEEISRLANKAIEFDRLGKVEAAIYYYTVSLSQLLVSFPCFSVKINGTICCIFYYHGIV